MPNVYKPGTDKISIVVMGDGGQETTFNDFRSYSINYDRFELSSAFTIILNDYGAESNALKIGKVIKIRLKGNKSVGNNLDVFFERIIFVGIIEKIEHSYNKIKNELIISGRDIASQFVDQYFDSTELFAQIADSTSLGDTFQRWWNKYALIKNNANIYIAIPELNIDQIMAHPQTIQLKAFQINIGDKVWDKMLELMKALNLLYFYDSYTSTLTIYPRNTKPYYAQHIHNIQCLKSNNNDANNVIECSYKEDISERYSDIYVLGTGNGSLLVDGTMPINSKHKCSTYGEVYDVGIYDAIVKDVQAIDRIKGYEIEYTVANHTSNRSAFSVYDGVIINDDVLGLYNYALTIYKLTYSMDINSGVRTKIVCGPYRIQDSLWAGKVAQKQIAEDYKMITVASNVNTINAQQKADSLLNFKGKAQ